VTIRVLEGPDAGRVFPGLKLPVTLGRTTSNQVDVNDPKVSSRHATIMRQAGQMMIRDEGSTNGTRVNGKRVERSGIGLGDIIQIGRSVLVVTFPSDSM
jgi:pSer/pThr/pTyr-binding forkhead associated (FHA) protein